MQRPGPYTLALLIVLAGSYVLQLVLESAGTPLVYHLGLFYELDPSLAWRVLTYPLVDGSVLNRLLGLLFSYWMLAPHEQRWGGPATLLLALAGTLGASLLCLPVGLLGFASPLVGLSGLLWAPIGRLLVDAADQPVQVFSLRLPNARAAIALLLLLPAASALYNHDVTPLLEALGAGAAGYFVGLTAMRRALRTPRRPPPKAARKHPFQVIRGGRDDDDERPKYLN